MKNIGRKIKTMRMLNDVSQEELAYALNVARQTVSKWEVGTMQPTTEKIKALSDYFGVTTDYFLSNDKNCDLPNEEVHNSDDETVAAVTPVKSKRKVAVILASIIVCTVVLIVSLVVGIIAIISNMPSNKGFETVGHLEVDWKIIGCLLLALIALVTLIVLLIYRKKSKK